MPLLWIAVGLAWAVTLLSLRGERARTRYWRTGEPQTGAYPPATVIIPVRGHDPALRENLESFAAQDYPNFQMIIAARSAEDFSVAAVPDRARIVYAGAPPRGRSEKVNNLLAAVRASCPAGEYLVFADADGRAGPCWLQSLVSAATQPEVGASTGYRWYLSEGFSPWSVLRSCWNATIAGSLGPGPSPLVWGGSMCISKRLFERLQVEKVWETAVSDDYALAVILRRAGLKVRFVPGALVASQGNIGGRELMRWIHRQLILTRFYALHLWAGGAIAHVIYTLNLAALGIAIALGNVTAAAGAVGPPLIGSWKAYRRVRVAWRRIPGTTGTALREAWAHALLAPLVTLIWTISLLRSVRGRSINWSGYTYKLQEVTNLN